MGGIPSLGRLCAVMANVCIVMPWDQSCNGIHITRCALAVFRPFCENYA